MTQISETLEILRFELKFLEDGGYGRSPHNPRRPPLAFEDSPTCLNFDDGSRPHPCGQCVLMQFVPPEQREQDVPCRFIPLTCNGETIQQFYGGGSQLELEDALKDWLRATIARLERQSSQAGA